MPGITYQFSIKMQEIRFRNKETLEETSVVSRRQHRGVFQLMLEDGSEIPETEFFDEWEQVLPDFIVQDDFGASPAQPEPPGDPYDDFVIDMPHMQNKTTRDPNAPMTEADYLAEFQEELDNRQASTSPPVAQPVSQPRRDAPPRTPASPAETNPVVLLLQKAAKEEYFFELSVNVKVPKRSLLDTVMESFPDDKETVVNTIMESLDMDETMRAIKAEVERYVETNNNS